MWFFLIGNVYVARMQNRILNSVVQKISNSINGLPTYLVQLDSIDIVILTVTQVPALERTSCGEVWHFIHMHHHIFFCIILSSTPSCFLSGHTVV
jgi:hypothetical protein